jgi:hypothetical protein
VYLYLLVQKVMLKSPENCSLSTVERTESRGGVEVEKKEVWVNSKDKDRWSSNG